MPQRPVLVQVCRQEAEGKLGWDLVILKSFWYLGFLKNSLKVLLHELLCFGSWL